MEEIFAIIISDITLIFNVISVHFSATEETRQRKIYYSYG